MVDKIWNCSKEELEESIVYHLTNINISEEDARKVAEDVSKDVLWI